MCVYMSSRNSVPRKRKIMVGCPFRFSLCQRIWIIAIFCTYYTGVCMCRIQYDGMPLQCLLYSLHYNVPGSISVSWFCDHSLYLSRKKNRHGHWVCWMSTGWKNGLMWRTHTHKLGILGSVSWLNEHVCAARARKDASRRRILCGYTRQ